MVMPVLANLLFYLSLCAKRLGVIFEVPSSCITILAAFAI